jgi:hypothetical protein
MWPEMSAATGRPAVKYQQAKYRVAQIIKYGISETVWAAINASQWYVFDCGCQSLFNYSHVY